MQRLAALLATLLIAGCAAPAATETADEPVTLEFSTRGCDIVAVVLLAPFDHIQERLPAGFRARDAQAMLGAPAPMGQGAILIEGYQCEEHTLAGGGTGILEVSFLVDAPDVPGEREPATTDLYQPFLGTTGVGRDALSAIRWNTPDVNVTSAITPVAASGTGAFEILDAGGAAMTAQVTAPAPNTLAGTFRLWQVHPSGTASIDYTFETTIAAGSVQCELRADGLVANAIGITACAPGNSAGMLAFGVSMNAVGHWAPGVLPNAA